MYSNLHPKVTIFLVANKEVDFPHWHLGQYCSSIRQEDEMFDPKLKVRTRFIACLQLMLRLIVYWFLALNDWFVYLYIYINLPFFCPKNINLPFLMRFCIYLLLLLRYQISFPINHQRFYFQIRHNYECLNYRALNHQFIIHLLI